MHTDHLGTTGRLTDGSGTEVYRAEFDPHGQMLEEVPANNYLNSHKFTGYERDWTTKLDNAKARMYASKVGRFMQPDPLVVAAADATNPQSLNRYSYVGNDPVNLIDPTGLLPRLDCQFTGSVDGGSSYTCRWIDDSDFGGIDEPKPSGRGDRKPQKPKSLSDCQIDITCFANCVERRRLDNALKEIGGALGYAEAGRWASYLTWGGTIAAIANQGLNATSLGKYPKSGVGGASKRGMPTSWQHTVFGKVGQQFNKPWIGHLGRAFGRVAYVASAVGLVFEGAYDLTALAQCAAECSDCRDQNKQL